MGRRQYRKISSYIKSFNGEVLAMVTEGNVEDVDKAIAAAKNLFM